MKYFKAFLAGFVSTLVFHQGTLAILHAVGATARRPYSMDPTAPFHVPQVISLAFWGGLWGILLWLVIKRVEGSSLYWFLALLVGALGPSVVALFVVLPLKGQPVAGGWQPAILVGALLLNGAWGIGVALLMRLFRREITLKRVTAIFVTALTLAAFATHADGAEAVSKAQNAATSWLALTDSGKYSQSWDEAAALFRGAVTKADWEKALKASRSPLGALKSRKAKSATFTRTLPGAPDGEYVVIQYDSQFENKAAAVETVTPMREKDGSWRVSGYFIK